ncbi:hypothetical protein PYW08_007874 [Mythimna loreyi]|uniref:Uncharacterized protein n=1 Tax=Mythimna loreyi TaxID=667449 RepID=A0ACC2QDI4_9NEOP|nr:hypothetical protein PYW08_007874 [Mythimna loreyi]
MKNPSRSEATSNSRVSKANSASVRSGLTQNKQFTPSNTASVGANRSDAGTKATLDTLSMITTPWSTESGFSKSQKLSKSLSTWALDLDPDSSFSWTSVDPLTTTASSRLSTPVFSDDTLTLFVASTPCHSNHLFLPLMKSPSPRPIDSWTTETMTREGLLSLNSRIFNVGHAWRSPASSATDFYPSSSTTLKSRKGSRVSLSLSISSSQKKSYFPINYINHVTLSSDHPGLEWTFAKQHSRPVVISI